MSRPFPLTHGPKDPFSPIPLEAAGSRLRAGISLARAGDMSLARRRELPDRTRFLETLGAQAQRTYAVQQVHSKKVVVVDGRDPPSLVDLPADGMITSRPDAVLTVTVADCLPIFLVDRARGAFGLVHSGWKGTGIVSEAIRLMAVIFGTRPSDLSAAVGPGIGPCCYGVPEDRYERFRAEFGEHAVVRGPRGDFRLDLKAANIGLLEQAGVESILVSENCTSCSPELSSFRSEGAGFRRMLAFIGHWTNPGTKSQEVS